MVPPPGSPAAITREAMARVYTVYIKARMHTIGVIFQIKKIHPDPTSIDV